MNFLSSLRDWEVMLDEVIVGVLLPLLHDNHDIVMVILKLICYTAIV